MASAIRLHAQRDIGGDHVVSHTTWTPRSRLLTMLFAAKSLVFLLRLPTTAIVHVHLSEGGSYLREGLFLALAHRRHLTAVATLHGASFSSFSRRHPYLVSAVLRQANLVICLEHRTAEIARAKAPLVRVELLPNPVVTHDDPAPAPADTTDELVLFAGEVGLRKGVDVLCRGWPLVARRRPRARCLIVGPASDFQPPDSERLTVRPAAGAAEMQQLLLQARVVVLPARAESMPMILTEAMSVGRPFVSTPVGGVPELAAEGGVLVPVDDEVTLAERLIELLSDPTAARVMGERGRRFCVKTRSIEVIDARLRELYSAAIAARDERGTRRR
jgi:glycosyltransferase involved in cell wall biosynthesis